MDKFLLEGKRALLKMHGIRTTADLAARADTEGKSRFGVLKDIVGEDAAHWMLNELALKQCMPAPKKNATQRHPAIKANLYGEGVRILSEHMTGFSK